MRALAGSTRIAVAAWSALATLFHVYGALAGPIEPLAMRALHLSFLLPLAFLLWPARPGISPAHRPSVPDLALALLSILAGLHAVLAASRIGASSMGPASPAGAEVLLGAMALLLVVEALRRAVTPILAALVAAGLLLLLARDHLPGILHHHDAQLPEIVGALYLAEGIGLHGPVTGISATLVAIFVALGVASERGGAARFFRNLGARVAGRQDGGLAKVAVLASALSGTLSGASAARDPAAGSPVIPAMAKLGYEPHFAAGVAVSTSAASQFTPPVMGAGALAIAGISGIPYAQICLAAAIGVLLHMLAIVASVHFEAKRLRLPGIPEAGIPAWREVMRDAPLLLPILLLVLLLSLGSPPQLAAFWALLATFLVSWVHRHPRAILLVLPVAIAVALALARFGAHDAAWPFSIALGAASLLAMLWSRPGTRPLVREAFGVLVDAGLAMVVVALACAGAGILVACLAETGVAIPAPGAMLPQGPGGILLAGALLAAAMLLLGRGLQATAACVVGASLLAPVLVSLGAPVLAAHMLVLWFAVLADLMPPASAASRAAASLAGADPVLTSRVAGRFPLAGLVAGLGCLHALVVPMQGAWLDLLGAVLASAAGLVLAAAALAGHFRGRLALGWRVAVGTAAMLVLVPLAGIDPWARFACAAAIGAALWLAPLAFAPRRAMP